MTFEVSSQEHGRQRDLAILDMLRASSLSSDPTDVIVGNTEVADIVACVDGQLGVTGQPHRYRPHWEAERVVVPDANKVATLRKPVGQLALSAAS